MTTTAYPPKTGFGIFKTAISLGNIGLQFILRKGDIGEVLRHVTHANDGVIWFKPFNIAIIGHPDIRDILLDSRHTKGNVHEAIKSDIGSILVSLNPGHPREEIRSALQRYLDADHINNYAQIIQSITDRKLNAQADGQTLYLRDFCDHLTLEIMYRSLFANFVMDDTEREVFADAISTTVLTSFARAGAGSLAARLVSLLNRSGAKRDALFQRLEDLWGQYSILTHEELEKDAFGQLVLAAKHGKLTDEEARTQAIIIIAAGHETTSSALAWAMYQLAKQPEIQNQVRTEILQHTSPNQLDMSVLRQLPLLNQVIDEVLRLYAPVWIVTRQLGAPVTIDQMTLPKDTNVWMVTTAAHRWAEYFDNPDDFSLNHDKSLYRRYTMPFGAGYGSCVGAPFARTEMQIVIAELLRSYTLEANITENRHLRPIYSTAIRIPKSAIVKLIANV